MEELFHPVFVVVVVLLFLAIAIPSGLGPHKAALYSVGLVAWCFLGTHPLLTLLAVVLAIASLLILVVFMFRDNWTYGSLYLVPGAITSVLAYLILAEDAAVAYRLITGFCVLILALWGALQE